MWCGGLVPPSAIGHEDRTVQEIAMPYLVLMLAVLAETIGTTALQASQQFSRPLPSAIVVVAYGAAFYLLAIALKTFPVGIAYAMWSGMGIVFIVTA